jgi:hypothetical protein
MACFYSYTKIVGAWKVIEINALNSDRGLDARNGKAREALHAEARNLTR